MKQFDFYSTIGVAAPGAFLLFGMSFLIPQLKAVFLSEDMGLGNFGVFLAIAYVVGQFLQAFGNLVEWIWWKLSGGMPSDWPRSGNHSLLSPQQIQALEHKITSVLAIELEGPVTSLDADSWFGITRQAYAAVAQAGQSDRIDRFNANYGLNRGMATSLIIIAIAILFTAQRTQCGWMLLAAAGSVVFLIRMHRFGKYYARELFVQFLQLSSSGTIPKNTPIFQDQGKEAKND